MLGHQATLPSLVDECTATRPELCPPFNDSGLTELFLPFPRFFRQLVFTTNSSYCFAGLANYEPFLIKQVTQCWKCWLLPWRQMSVHPEIALLPFDRFLTF